MSLSSGNNPLLYQDLFEVGVLIMILYMYVKLSGILF